MSGKRTFAEKKPPTIKQQVAISEGICRVDKPIMACPLVQPPAYRVPKPTKKPPITKKKSPFRVKIFSTLNMSAGIILVKSVMPNADKLAMVLSAITMLLGLLKNWVAIKPPNNTPTTKNIFQISFFQLYLKNGIFAGTHIAHTCRKEDEIPNFLLPISNKVGTVKPIKTPATAQCHGCFINSIIFICYLQIDLHFAKFRHWLHW